MDHLRAFVDQARRVELLVRVGPVAPAVGEPLAEPGARDLAPQLGLEPAAAPWVPLVTARSRSRSSACMSAWSTGEANGELHRRLKCGLQAARPYAREIGLKSQTSTPSPSAVGSLSGGRGNDHAGSWRPGPSCSR